MTNNQAATYARSSKDRSDVSIDAQRRKLAELARSEKRLIVAEFSDVVESADDWTRPGFAELLRALKHPSRTWSTLYVYDTARIAREDDYLRATFNHECRSRGVTVRYAMLPTGDNPLMELMVNRVATTYDAMHSMTSRIKGLSGMAENVRRGFRAGGRAPWGYRLEHVQTGAIRDGMPVTKSRLVLSDDADTAAAYLKGRAAGRSRSLLRHQLGIRLPETSLVGVEWNALTYAGHTVWNVHNAYDRGGYRGGIKRRPREQWVIQRSTHEPLITDDEAETIVRRLEASPFKKKRRTGATYLLTGILQAPDGASWYGDKGGRYYRISKKGPGASRSLDAAAVDKLVLGLVTTDLRSPRFVANTLQHTKRILGRDHSAKLAELRQEHGALGRRIDRFMDMAAELETRGPVLRKVNAIEREREQLERRIAELEESSRTAATVASITESDVARLLTGMADEMDRYDRESLKDGLSAILERVELDPATLELRLDYRIGLPVRNKLASPRESKVIPLVNSTSSKVA